MTPSSDASGFNAVNRLLQILPESNRRKLAPHLEPFTLTFGDLLVDVGEPIRHVYFPTTGFISLIALSSSHSTLEVGLIGNEGMFGASLILGVRQSLLRAQVQGSGSALRMDAAVLRKLLKETPKLDRHLHRYLYVGLAEMARASVCTRFHLVEARLARWLLMTQDRAYTHEFDFKHEFLATMLGVRRSGITIAAGSLQRRRLIRYNRGHITVVDREGLENASCECYHLVKATYQRLLGRSGEI